MKKLSLSTILTAMILLTFTMAFTPHVHAADGTVISVEPATVDIAAVGETQTVDINITDVTSLYAYEIKIFYQSAIVNTINNSYVTRPTGHFMEPVEPANYFVPKWEVNNTYNATWGRIYVGYTLLSTETPKTGSGILLRINFTGIGVGSTPIVLAESNLADGVGAPITHTVSNGTITVIPEITMLLPIFAVTSLIAISLAKLKRKKQLH